jgi:hypothetical protein
MFGNTHFIRTIGRQVLEFERIAQPVVLDGVRHAQRLE